MIEELESTQCRDAYERDFGHPYAGEMDGELGWAEVNELYA